MANTKSAAKRARQIESRTLQNRRALTQIKSTLKSVRAAIAAKNKETAQAEFQKVTSALDRAVKTGRIHRNSANRHKGILNKALAGIA